MDTSLLVASKLSLSSRSRMASQSVTVSSFTVAVFSFKAQSCPGKLFNHHVSRISHIYLAHEQPSFEAQSTILYGVLTLTTCVAVSLASRYRPPRWHNRID